jgi:hypothetical protein
MWIRSPRLRRQLISSVAVSAVFIYFVSKISLRDDSLLLYFTVSLLFVFTGALLNKYLFSAEGKFFDKMLCLPAFHIIFEAKYRLLVATQTLMLVAFLFVMAQNRMIILSIFLYNIGVISLLSFCSIMFVTNKIDLFGSQMKMTNAVSIQDLAVGLAFGIASVPVSLLSWFTSITVSMIFMAASGILVIILRRYWFNFLYRMFRTVRYEKMELLRIN